MDDIFQSVHECGEDIEATKKSHTLVSVVYINGRSCQEVPRRGGLAHGIMGSLNMSI